MIVHTTKADAVDIRNPGCHARLSVVSGCETSHKRSAIRSFAVDGASHVMSLRFTRHRFTLSHIGTAAVVRPSAIEDPRSRECICEDHDDQSAFHRLSSAADIDPAFHPITTNAGGSEANPGPDHADEHHSDDESGRDPTSARRNHGSALLISTDS